MVKIFGTHKVFIRYDTLNGCYNELVLYACLQFLEVILKIGGRCYEYKRVVFLYNTVDVA